MNGMKVIGLIAFVIGITAAASAQVERESQDLSESGNIKLNRNKVYGKLVDASHKGIAAASVELYGSRTQDPDAGRDTLLAVVLSKTNGDFRFSGFPVFSTYKVVITAVGYQRLELPVTLAGPGQESAFEKDLGNLSLETEARQLGMVTVVAQKPMMQLGVDRKVFNVEKNITATGGTGLDVLKNIPSVSVNVDGTVELRNSTPTIYIDGRPTILTLDQIPSGDIEKVELITNPSAKFDAASSGGIINIILKKNRRLGLNGIASAGAGTPGILNGNLNLSLRQGKFNFFASGGYNRSGGVATGEALRQNKTDGMVDSYFNQHSTDDRLRRFQSVRFGVDYFLDNRNTLSLSQGLVRGRFATDETQNQENLDASQTLQYTGLRTSLDTSGFDRHSTNLHFIHKFPQEGKELSADVNYNGGGHHDNTHLVNTYAKPDGSPYADPNTVHNYGTDGNNQWTFQVDFTDPRGKDSKLETGMRSYINEYNSVFSAFSLNNGSPEKLPLSNDYRYTEIINALYVTYTGKWKDIGYQLGLRGEQSKFDGLLVDSSFKFGYQYPSKIRNIWDAFFPSVFLTKPISDHADLQLNYSRRIRRPNFWQLNPFIDISDPLNLRQGNPQLKPEFTNSFELNYSLQYGHGSNLLVSLYYRNNQGDITGYSDTLTAAEYQRLHNAAIDPNAILNTFLNAQSTNRLGAEFTVQQKIGKNFDITPTLEFQYRKVNARINNLDLSNEGFNWSSKLISNYKIETSTASLLNNLSFQLVGEYRSPMVIPQGKRAERYSVDLAMKKEFLKNRRASLTFNVNDVFNTNRYGTIYDTENFYQYSYGRWNVRSFRVVLSYKFGKSDFSLFKKNSGNNRGGEEE
ncbi:MAG TPA: TonB-dependent receptor [Chitinophagaceae bacterium]|nr:TonB-dependent receptor [Chitinophagaceae bacterium]